MKTSEIAVWLKHTIEPLHDRIYGDRYRASVVLRDGTYLPCVVFQSNGRQVELAQRRFDELRTQSAQYRQVVESFVASGSRLANYEIETVEPSPFAWPHATLNTIHGEISVGWTALVVEMQDGTLHSFGTSFSFEFFDLPQGYTYANIAQIHSGMVYSQARGMAPFSLDAGQDIATYREKPYFNCYLPEL
jgi:hypothetical protein